MMVRKIGETRLKGRIVETECYPGGEDKASCTFNGKRSPATEALYMDAGTAFVYMTYGMYHCINISSSEPGGGVLIRALEPLEGIEDMRKWRIDKTKSKKDIKTKDLCNGPSKLCTSLQITKNDCNMMDFKTSESMWIEDDPNFLIGKIVCTSRIGIAAAGKEWAEKPYRYYIFGSDYVSKRDLKKEKPYRYYIFGSDYVSKRDLKKEKEIADQKFA
ncbi:Methylpurine-DNA glycosylase (MPG) [Popillia japonica]|uniref:DNA-3-methyladenine glycosylase n=1 Tax=Popillia japonica TaxID=7064 RepID=A0AAW1JCH2_POPJA